MTHSYISCRINITNSLYFVCKYFGKENLELYNVIFYEDEKGNSPIRSLIYELSRSSSKSDRIHLNKIFMQLKALESHGTRIGSPTVKHINGNIWELRPLDNRIFFFYWQDDTFVLLHHFKKKSQKTPSLEIERATNNMASFLERNKVKIKK